jgi:Putative amidoligase enzyme
MSLARILGKSKGRQTFISDSRWVLPQSFIGLEHEYEGVKDSTLPKHTFADFWTYHEEGSLKDNGAEFVFTTPLFGVDAYNALEWIVAYAKDSKWKCTKRTGIHVHLDVRDLTVPQLAGLCILYAAVEPILYHWVGDGRDSSHFCIPLYRADEALLGTCAIVRSAFQDDLGDGHNALARATEFQRYAGFNLQALAKFGSIEFRQLQTTHDLVRIVDWINMIMSLKATAFKLPQSDGAVVRMIQRMGARELLSYVFPTELAAKLYTPKSEEEFVTRGLSSARDIAVHGCGEASWVKQDYPKGEHKGFIKWIKEAKPAPEPTSEEMEEDPDVRPVREEPIWEDEPPVAVNSEAAPGQFGAFQRARPAELWQLPPAPGNLDRAMYDRIIMQDAARVLRAPAPPLPRPPAPVIRRR